MPAMTTFDEREKTFEKKFVHDQELRFRAIARRDKLLGLWAAEKLGLTGAEAEGYADDLVALSVTLPKDDDLVLRLLSEFKTKGVNQSEHQVRRTLDETMRKAERQIASETH
jgi:hypothetical protein